MQKTAMTQEAARFPVLALRHLEWATLILAAPFLLSASLFHPAVSLTAMLLLAVPFVVRLVTEKRLSRYSPANWAIGLLLAVFVPLSFIASPLPWAVSWTRVTTLVWSVALCFAALNWPSQHDRKGGRTRLNPPTILYLVLGALVALAGIFGMRSVDKLYSISLPTFLPDLLGLETGLATNEVAGVLTLFIPLAAALALGGWLSGRRQLALVMVPLSLLLLLALLLAQSRTAMAATGLALLLVLALIGRPNRWWLVAGLVLAGVAVLVLSLTDLADTFIYAGANSWSSVITPRLEVWEQGLYALRDFPLWGIGLGVFGFLAPRMYPQAPLAQAKLLEDAHNFYLQNALDFGLFGGLLVLAILAITLWHLGRMISRRPRGTLSRALMVGLFASIAAHLLYGLTDAVALGTLAGVPLWFALGLALGRVSRDRAPDRSWPKVLVTTGAAVLLAGFAVAAALPTNWGATLAANELLAPEPPGAAATAAEDIGRLAARDCDLLWHQGLLYHWRGEGDKRTAAWDGALRCTGRFTDMMRLTAPDDARLAQRAIELRPNDAAGYFWLASLSADAPTDAIALYRQGLEREPSRGEVWQALGDLLVADDPDGALEAYLQSCLNGDPGANGCLRAGAVAEQQGKIEDAIRYYRLSKYSESQQRAAELERRQAVAP